MPRTIFITEGSSPLGVALVRLLGARGYALAVAREAETDGAAAAAAPAALGAGGSGGMILTVPWRRRSAASARAAFLSVVNAVESVQEVLILEPPPASAPAALARAASADIERALDDAKGPLFMAREALGHFARAGAGVLCMVSGGPADGPLEAAAREAFRGASSSLMAAPTPGLIVNGFQSAGAGPEEYAAFIDRTLEEKARAISGRWFAFPARGGFLQGVRSGFRTASTP
jgi:NAD(P)-dependent dehydrogenase (short-subunit alcohol dehydrogenase family)